MSEPMALTPVTSSKMATCSLHGAARPLARPQAPQPRRARRFGEHSVGQLARLRDFQHAEFERVVLGVADGGFIQAGNVREIAEIADLQDAGEGRAVFARPRRRQPERGQHPAVQVGKGGDNHSRALFQTSVLGRWAGCWWSASVLRIDDTMCQPRRNFRSSSDC